MILNRIYRKYFLLASALLIFFVVLGFFLSSFLMRFVENNREPMPPLFFARVVDHIGSEDRIEGLREVLSWKTEFPMPEMILLDGAGQVLFPPNGRGVPHWDNIEKPQRAYEYKSIEMGPPPKRPPFWGPPPPPRIADTLVKLDGEPEQYLYIKARGMRPPPPQEKDRRYLFPLITFGSLVVSLLLGVGTTIAIIYNGVRKGVSQADTVISELHKGNLKARFDIRRRDEFGQAMLRFNTMADEIEKLVLNLKEVDQARTRLLQELAHDLRTPIASMKNLLEILNARADKLDVETQREVVGLSLKEIYYFERLVDDLLFLAQIRDASLQNSSTSEDISVIIAETSDDVWSRYQHQDQKIDLQQNISAASYAVNADSHLLRRLLRNTIENSFSFAKSAVKVELQALDDRHIEILVIDDGPGFSNEALQTFGRRRVTRKLESSPNGRLSVGLGSVVMKTIVDSLGGELQVTNEVSQGKVLGAKVRIILPTIKA